MGHELLTILIIKREENMATDKTHSNFDGPLRYDGRLIQPPRNSDQEVPMRVNIISTPRKVEELNQLMIEKPA